MSGRKGTEITMQTVSYMLMFVIGIVVALIIWKIVDMTKPASNPSPTMPSGPVCGNGNVEGGEECDDGNTADGDGCSGSCRIEREALTVT